jgi:hypothetical protein
MARGGKAAGAALGAVLVVLLSAGCSAVGLTLRDPGPEQTQTRTVSAVSAVELASSGDMVLTRGDTPSLRITAGRNVLRHLTSDIHGDRLTLGSDGSLHRAGHVHYDLVLPAVRVVELSGSGAVRVRAPSALQQALLPGSGDIRIDGLQTDSLSVGLSGSGQIAVAGSTTRQRVSIDGSGDYSAGGLESLDAEVSISGSGDADAAVSRTLTVSISGSGSVTYIGNPTVTRSISGSGDVVGR